MTYSEQRMIYEVSGSNRTRLVIIESFALNNLRNFRQLDNKSHESGGVLIGERRGSSIIVKEITTPTNKDKSSRFMFIRKIFGHQNAVNNANKKSYGVLNYLGEWHTHPQDLPYPSTIDFTNWISSLKDLKPCLVCVVGRHEEWWALYENGEFKDLNILSL